jgi:hypothetical protein
MRSRQRAWQNFAEEETAFASRLAHTEKQKPLTLTLSRRERGLTGVDARAAPT